MGKINQVINKEQLNEDQSASSEQGSYDNSELVNFDLKDYIDIDLLNKDVKTIVVPEGKKLNILVTFNCKIVNSEDSSKKLDCPKVIAYNRLVERNKIVGDLGV